MEYDLKNMCEIFSYFFVNFVSSFAHSLYKKISYAGYVPWNERLSKHSAIPKHVHCARDEWPISTFPARPRMEPGTIVDYLGRAKWASMRPGHFNPV
jgi:hypothetical protein